MCGPYLHTSSSVRGEAKMVEVAKEKYSRLLAGKNQSTVFTLAPALIPHNS
jgi:hypothetical protein